MTPFHCYNCNKLLGMIDGKAEIKCPRCKMISKTDKWPPSIVVGSHQPNN